MMATSKFSGERRASAGMQSWTKPQRGGLGD